MVETEDARFGDGVAASYRYALAHTYTPYVRYDGQSYHSHEGTTQIDE